MDWHDAVRAWNERNGYIKFEGAGARKKQEQHPVKWEKNPPKSDFLKVGSGKFELKPREAAAAVAEERAPVAPASVMAMPEEDGEAGKPQVAAQTAAAAPAEEEEETLNAFMHKGVRYWRSSRNELWLQGIDNTMGAFQGIYNPETDTIMPAKEPSLLSQNTEFTITTEERNKSEMDFSFSVELSGGGLGYFKRPSRNLYDARGRLVGIADWDDFAVYLDMEQSRARTAADAPLNDMLRREEHRQAEKERQKAREKETTVRAKTLEEILGYNPNPPRVQKNKGRLIEGLRQQAIEDGDIEEDEFFIIPFKLKGKNYYRLENAYDLWEMGEGSGRQRTLGNYVGKLNPMTNLIDTGSREPELPYKDVAAAPSVAATAAAPASKPLPTQLVSAPPVPSVAGMTIVVGSVAQSTGDGIKIGDNVSERKILSYARTDADGTEQLGRFSFDKKQYLYSTAGEVWEEARKGAPKGVIGKWVGVIKNNVMTAAPEPEFED